ncbi:hypothetical protein Q9233_007262 [Columba guinea]|nr:hypothetical protein Q9233_007262 [Columba guinea]
MGRRRFGFSNTLSSQPIAVIFQQCGQMKLNRGRCEACQTTSNDKEYAQRYDQQYRLLSPGVTAKSKAMA